MYLKLIEHLSREYEQMIRLREGVLLRPVGIPVSYIKPETEAGDLLIGAFEGDKLIGCCLLTHRSQQSVQLRQMAVAADLQSRGLGSKIIQFAEEVAAAHHYSLLYLHARNDVIPFYLKCGYEIAGAEFFEVDIAHHRMEKNL